LVVAAVAYPVYFVVIASISDPAAVSVGQVIWKPEGINFEAYRFIFSDSRILRGYANSLFYAAGQTLFALAITIPGAYALSRKELIGNRAIMLYLIFTMYFSGGIIPFYVLMRRIGMIDSAFALMLPNAVVVFNVIVARTFFAQTIPREMLESAQIDGCSDLRFFLSVVLPLSPAILAIIALFSVVGSWNAFFHALLFINDRAMYPLQLILRDILILGGSMVASDIASTMSPEELARRQSMSELLRYALIVVAIAPLLILYPFIQKHFVRGIMVGSIKG
jgi:putative aldouronate transport system permease protein